MRVGRENTDSVQCDCLTATGHELGDEEYGKVRLKLDWIYFLFRSSAMNFKI